MQDTPNTKSDASGELTGSPDLASAVPEGSGGKAARADVRRRKPHEVLARELGISDKTVREKRKLGMSDDDIATEAAVLSPKHDPLKFKREEPASLPLLDTANQDIPAAEAGSLLRTENLRARQLSNEQEAIKLRKLKGELLSVDEVLEEVLPAFTAVKDGVMAMVESLAPRLAPVSDPAEIRRLMYADVLSCFDGLEKVIRAGRSGQAAA
jgi:hypothetical protein